MSLPENLDFLSDGMLRNDPWYAEGVKFTCQSGCTRCCGGAPGDVFISQDELRAIAAFMQMEVRAFKDQYVRQYFPSGKMSLKERFNGDCEMLTEKGCGIYDVRPKQCRDYPFWPEVMKSVFSWIREADRCPGINEGETHVAPKISEMLKSQQTGK